MGSLFDYNRDGKVDSTEKAAMYAVFMAMQEDRENDSNGGGNSGCLFAPLFNLFEGGASCLYMLVIGFILISAPLLILAAAWTPYVDLEGGGVVFALIVIGEAVYLYYSALSSQQPKKWAAVVTAVAAVYVLALSFPLVHEDTSGNDSVSKRKSILKTHYVCAEAIAKHMGFSHVEITRQGTSSSDEQGSLLEPFKLLLSAEMPEPMNYLLIQQLETRLKQRGHAYLMAEHGNACSCREICVDYDFCINGTRFDTNGDQLIDMTHGRRIVRENPSYEDIRDGLPFVGMESSWIDFSKLGKPTTETDSASSWRVPADQLYTTYKWYDDKGNFQAEAIVRYYLIDPQAKIRYGYVTEVRFTEK